MARPRREINIRTAIPDDAEAIARLSGELGYPTRPADARRRLFDIKTFFLYGLLSKPVYMEQPDGWDTPEFPKADYICKLKKTLYGRTTTGLQSRPTDPCREPDGER